MRDFPDFPNASEERSLRNISRHSRVLFERIPGTQGIRRVASSYRLKITEPPHFRMHTISSVLGTVEGRDYMFKIDLQDLYFQLLIFPHSRKYLCFAFENKVYQFRVLHFSLNTAPHVLTCLGHSVAAYLHLQGISVIPYRNDSLIHHPDRQVLLHHQSQLLNILNMVGLRLNEANSELEPVQDIQFLGLPLLLDQGRASLPVSKAREIWHTSCRISSQKTLSYREVSQFMGSLNRASGLIPLGHLHLRPLQRHFHSLGLTNRFSTPRSSDPPTLLRQ